MDELLSGSLSPLSQSHAREPFTRRRRIVGDGTRINTALVYYRLRSRSWIMSPVGWVSYDLRLIAVSYNPKAPRYYQPDSLGTPTVSSAIVSNVLTEHNLTWLSLAFHAFTF